MRFRLFFINSEQARTAEQRVSEHDQRGVIVLRSASRFSAHHHGWELILQAASIQDVQARVGVDLDYIWETG